MAVITGVAMDAEIMAATAAVMVVVVVDGNELLRNRLFDLERGCEARFSSESVARVARCFDLILFLQLGLEWIVFVQSNFKALFIKVFADIAYFMCHSRVTVDFTNPA